jgi:2-methylisocitrate lyase-like PEP mutase family enzyme
LREIGYAFAIYPSMTSLVAAAAMEHGLRLLKENGSYEELDLFNFKEFCGLIGFEDVWAFEKKWAQ